LIDACFQAVCFQRHARQEGDRRVEPQRLAEHVAREGQLLGVLDGDGIVTSHRLHLSSHTLAGRRMHGEQIDGPGERAGSGFVAGQKEHAKLIDQFFAREALRRCRRRAPR
jgi:hypothetical protein